jgi:haloacetate dehalogenase
MLAHLQCPTGAFTTEVNGNSVHYRSYGDGGPGLLLIHGFPRTHLMWRDLAPLFARAYTVVCIDLRGYGGTGTPASTEDHFPYSKRAMAQEGVELMAKLGFPSFDVAGHDRGGRVAYRMALDHPQAVKHAAVLDVLPMYEAWLRADARFAQFYWPWVLLSQAAPLPESYLLGAPEAAFHNPFGSGSFGDDILHQYAETFRNPERVHAICEEYRAAATIDREHDRLDRASSRQIKCPLLHLWAEGGALDQNYAADGGPLGIWRQWAPKAVGQPMKGGHFFPEENPQETFAVINEFLAA